MPLSPQQRQLILYGAPVVAVFALINVLGKRSQPAEPAPAGPPQGYTLPIAPSTDAIGVGQLSEWENLIGQSITELGAALSEQIAAIPQAPAPTTPTTPPAPTQTCTPKFPWRMEGGILVDTVTGRPAFFGPQSQPGMAYTPGQAIPAGWATWQMPDGRWVLYNPANWAFGDASRPPICH